jgi:hypothetical protein
MEENRLPQLRIELCGVLGGWLLNQALCLSDYHNNRYARYAGAIGIFLVLVPYMIPFTTYIARRVPTDRWATWRKRVSFIDADIVLTTVAIIVGILLSIRIYSLPKPNNLLSSHTWQPLTNSQEAELLDTIDKLPRQNVLIFRPDYSDAEALADSLATSLDDKWTLLKPPYNPPFAPQSWGINLMADNVSDPTVPAFKNALEHVVGRTVYLVSFPPDFFSRSDRPNIVIVVGAPQRPKFVLSGIVNVPANSRSVTIPIAGAPQSYRVTAFTSWGATASVSDIDTAHFILTFSTPASQSPQGQTVNWTAFRY